MSDGVVYVLGAPKWAHRDLRRADEVIEDVRVDVSFETRWLDASVGRLWRLRVDLDWLELRSDAGALELVTGGARRVVLESGDPLGDAVFARDRDRRWSLVSWSSRLVG